MRRIAALGACLLLLPLLSVCASGLSGRTPAGDGTVSSAVAAAAPDDGAGDTDFFNDAKGSGGSLRLPA